jgi:hypothetical protein
VDSYAVAGKRPAAQFGRYSPWLNLTISQQKLGAFSLPRFRRKTFCADAVCLMLAARLVARVNVRAMRKTQLGRKCFAAFEFSDAPRQRINPAR